MSLTQSSFNILSNRKSVGLNQNQNNIKTLPITCQICLGKVKDPCVCPNLHTFCSGCIEVWLEKGQQCPTCRVPISKENPCRRILGGVENLDEADMMKPSDFSHSSIRKARYLNVFQQYEEEISRLLKYIDSLNLEVTKLKDSTKYKSQSPHSSDPAQNDILHTLKNKLQQSLSNLNEVTIERDSLKETNKKLDSENSILMQDTIRLKLAINEKNSQMSNKYTVAALETKIETHEKEIKQLQKALEKSDRYIAELENPDQIRPKSQKENQTLNSESFINTNTKSVKFADKIDTFEKPQQNILTSPSSNRIAPGPVNKQISITKDNFYGSPSKKSPAKASGPTSMNIKSISSFSDRLKNTNGSNLQRDLFSSSNTDTASSQNSTRAHQANSLLTFEPTTSTSTTTNSNTHSFLFSPMKRLRLDEVVLEKPDETITNVTLGNSSNSSSGSNDILKTPPKNISKPPFSSNTKLLNDKTPTKKSLKSADAEFSDCLKLLNQAEKKVQKRLSPSTVNHQKEPLKQSQCEFSIPEKYFQQQQQTTSNTTENTENHGHMNNFIDFNSATLNTMKSNGATISSASHDESSMNSMTFVSNSIQQIQPVPSVNRFQLNSQNLSAINYQNSSMNQKFASMEQGLSYHQMQPADNGQNSNEALYGNNRQSSDLEKLGINSN